MTDYIVGIIVPFKDKITYKIVNSEEEIKKILDSKGRGVYDYIVIKREIDNEGIEQLTLQKRGYEKVYSIVNKIFVLFAIILLLLFSYLYYKYLKNKT
jgi:hypothetical protein